MKISIIYSKFKDLFKIQLVKTNTIYEPTKKLLKITPEKYDCANNYIYVKATLYDIENISKNWNKTNVQQKIKQKLKKHFFKKQTKISF